MSDGVLAVGYRRGKVEAFVRRYRAHLLVPILGAAGFACAVSLWVASPSTPSLRMFIGPLVIAVGLGLLAGLVVAMVSDAANPNVRVARDVAVATGYDVCGVIPSRSKRSSPALVALTDPHSSAAEAYRQLHRRLVAALPNPNSAAVLLAGVRGADDATLTAANLAVASALDGYSTALVDLDLTSPTLHYLFSVDNTCGMSQVLAGSALGGAVRPINRVPHLAVVPAGQFSADVAERIDVRRLDGVMLELRRRFDVVIVAAAPVLDHADPFGMPPYCDGVMLITSSRTTKKKDATAAADKLDRAHAPVIGAALTDYRRDLNGPTVDALDASSFRRNQHRVTPSLEPLLEPGVVAVAPSAATTIGAIAAPAGASARRPASWTPPRGYSKQTASGAVPIQPTPSAEPVSSDANTATFERRNGSCRTDEGTSGVGVSPAGGRNTTLDMPRTEHERTAAPQESLSFRPPSHRPSVGADVVDAVSGSWLESERPSATARKDLGTRPPDRVQRGSDHGAAGARPRGASGDEVGAVARPSAEAMLTASQTRVLAGLQVRLAALQSDRLASGAVASVVTESAAADRIATPRSRVRVERRPGAGPHGSDGGRTSSKPGAEHARSDGGLDARTRQPVTGTAPTGRIGRTGDTWSATSPTPIEPTESVVPSTVVVPTAERAGTAPDAIPSATDRPSSDGDGVDRGGFAPLTAGGNDTSPAGLDRNCGTEVAIGRGEAPGEPLGFDPELASADRTGEIERADVPDIAIGIQSAKPAWAGEELPAPTSPPRLQPTEDGEFEVVVVARKRRSVVRIATATKASARSRTVAKRATTKKPTTKKPTVKKPAAKKAAAKSVAKKSTAKKSTAKKSTAKKSTAKKSTAKKSTAKKYTAKKSTAKKASARPTPKKAAPKKTASKKSPAKKASARKAAAPKTTARKSATRVSTTKPKPKATS